MRRSSTRGIHNGCRVHVRWVDAEDMTLEEGARAELAGVDGVLVPGGFGSRGWEGKILACRVGARGPHSLSRYLPRYARRRVGGSRVTSAIWTARNSTEMDPETPFPVIDLLPEQKEIEDLGGTMRLGAQAVELAEGTRTRDVYGGETVITERHRHRYEVNNAFRQQLIDAGLVVSGTFPGGPARGDRRAARPSLVRRLTVPSRVQVAAHAAPRPLFREFVTAALQRSAHAHRRVSRLTTTRRVLAKYSVVSQGRAGRPDAVSSVAPIALLSGRPASLPRNDHRTPATKRYPAKPS